MLKWTWFKTLSSTCKASLNPQYSFMSHIHAPWKLTFSVIFTKCDCVSAKCKWHIRPCEEGPPTKVIRTATSHVTVMSTCHFKYKNTLLIFLKFWRKIHVNYEFNFYFSRANICKWVLNDDCQVHYWFVYNWICCGYAFFG